MVVAASALSAGSVRPPSLWLREHIAAIAIDSNNAAPVLHSSQVSPAIAGLDLWDIWPIQNEDGSVADIAGGSLWMILSAPRSDDPDMRHSVARIRLLQRIGTEWVDCGEVFPDGCTPGSREWSGSAFIAPNSSVVHCYFTAAGRRGDSSNDFEQRLFHSRGELSLLAEQPRIANWSKPALVVENDGTYYVDLTKDQGQPGLIRGFRDPFWFCDPADGRSYILFTGSVDDAATKYSGVVGIAASNGGGAFEGFDLLPPLISAVGVANELERPHLMVRDGLYYLFWSSQSSIFAPDAPKAPSGLYGMVADRLLGTYRPLNGTGLVVANPPAEPYQAYCWQVTEAQDGKLEIVSFVDYWDLGGKPKPIAAQEKRKHFGGTIAPSVFLEIEGDQTKLVGG